MGVHIPNLFWQLQSLTMLCWSEWKQMISFKSHFPGSDILTKQYCEILILVKSMRILALMTHWPRSPINQNCEEFTKLAKLSEDKCSGLKTGISCSLQFLWLGCLHWSMGVVGFGNVFQWITSRDQNSNPG